ncbi:hypothetical protein EYZ11_004583 [Aspergillus tanneri]|nr:hypothetical protein EYZ11_004583 [Aspergillus tanneri]
MAFFPRVANDFAPLFRLLNDYDVHRSSCQKNKAVPVRSFTPRFDVYERNDCYHLDGELPGVDQNNIDIEFTDPHTLVIKGHVQRNYSNTMPDDNEITDDASSIRSLQPTVEDEEDEEPPNATVSAGSPTHISTAPPNKATVHQEQSSSGPAYKYWASERSIGQFHRVFTFPTRVDQEAVRASLRDGILSVIVPKEPVQKMKKVRIE